MGICHSRIAPYEEDSYKKAQNYAASITPDIVETTSKIRYTLITSKVLTTEMINTECLLDFTLAMLYTSIITNHNSFTENYKLCCILLYHSSLIVTRLYISITTQDKSFTLEDNECLSEPDTLRTLMKHALRVQSHPLITWTSIIIGIVPEYNDLYEVFSLFSNYCHALFNHLSNCSNNGKLPPQLQYRIEYQKYNPSLRSQSVYADECKRIDESLTKLMTLCERAKENDLAASGQTQSTFICLRPRRVNSFVPELETVEE